MKHKRFCRSTSLGRAVVIVSVAVLGFAPVTGVAAADTAVVAPPRPGGLDFGSQLDPRLLADLKAIETRVLQEQDQGRQLQQQKQGIEAKIQDNNQKASAVQRKVSDWNSKAGAVNQQAVSLQAQIAAHNAKPNIFRLPQQQAAYTAYNNEAVRLQSERSRIQSRQSELDQEKSVISAEQTQVTTDGRQLEGEKQQLNRQITDFNNGTRQLESQLQQLLQQIVSALQDAAAAQRENAIEGAQAAAGGDHRRPAVASEDAAKAGNDGGDPGSPKAIKDALDKYGADNNVTVDKRPARVLLTPDTVTRLSPDKAAGLSPYRTYDGLVRTQGTTYTALEVSAPEAPPTPFSQVINQGGQATVEVDGETRVITRVQTVPSGRTDPQPPRPRIDCGPVGWDKFQDTDPSNGNRAQGVVACLNRGYLAAHKGTPADERFRPPGYHWARAFAHGKNLPPRLHINACHLLAAQLGGSGQDLKNLSTCSRGANARQRDSEHYADESYMSAWEDQVKTAIKDGDAQVMYTVTPDYAENRTIPVSYRITAYGTYPDGAPMEPINVEVPNTLVTGDNLGTQTDDRGQPVPTGKTT